MVNVSLLNVLLLLLICKCTLSSSHTDGVENSSNADASDSTGCILGACFLEPRPGDDHRLPPKKELACRDLRDDCQSRIDECDLVGQLIWAECPQTCQICHDRRVRSIVITATGEDFAAQEEALLKPIPRRRDVILDGVSAEYGVLQRVTAVNANGVEDFQFLRKIVDRAKKVQEHMEEGRSAPSMIASNCRNEHYLCMYWAVAGECQNNPAYMLASCGPSCFSCY